MRPATPDAQSQIARLLHAATQQHQAGRFDEAKDLYEKLLLQESGQPDGLHQFGILCHQMGENDRAEELLRKAVRQSPDNPAFLLSLGLVFKVTDRIDEAIRCYRRALELRPNTPEILNNIGNACLAANRPVEAITNYQKALQLKPDSFEIIFNLGGVLKSCGRLAESIDQFRKALALNPGSLDGRSHLLLALNYTSGYTPETVFQEYLRFAKIHVEPLSHHIRRPDNSPDPKRRLRIGYVSADFRMHSVSYFIEPVLEHHDRERCEIFAYYNHTQIDDVTERVRGNCDHWRSLVGLRDDQAADLIVADRIDLLVDLAGHTAHNRLLVFARKPAPVQVSWLGYPNTTGLATIDYRITDGFADPVGQTDQFYTERLMRLPECFSCYKPPQPAPDEGPLPALKNGYVTFGSFNNIAKITPEVIELWAQILHSLPDSKLLLKNRALNEPEIQEFLGAEFLKAGIPHQRLQFCGPDFTQTEHLKHCRLADIGLDTFPYDGTTTTCDTLWMGIPVITLAGNTHAARVGVSILQNVGCPDLIAATREDYVAIANRLAMDLEYLGNLRAGLRDRMAASPLTDAVRFTQNLEAAFREMWQRWCRR